MTEVEISIHAGEVPADELEHALATGKNHVRHGKKVYLLTRELKEKQVNYKNGFPEIQMPRSLPVPVTRLKNFRPLSLKNF